ncbi:MAG: hypothetical protein LBR29_12015, partial [Methylobacteriaceae bacterium]|nr:hypothetical protein [Methylobacteriaceae bacterium]
MANGTDPPGSAGEQPASAYARQAATIAGLRNGWTEDGPALRFWRADNPIFLLLYDKTENMWLSAVRPPYDVTGREAKISLHQRCTDALTEGAAYTAGHYGGREATEMVDTFPFHRMDTLKELAQRSPPFNRALFRFGALAPAAAPSPPPPPSPPAAGQAAQPRNGEPAQAVPATEPAEDGWVFDGAAAFYSLRGRILCRLSYDLEHREYSLVLYPIPGRSGEEEACFYGSSWSGVLHDAAEIVGDRKSV